MGTVLKVRVFEETPVFTISTRGLIQQAATEREPKDSGLNLHRNEHGLFDIPPGFVRGLEVGGGGSGSGSLI